MTGHLLLVTLGPIQDFIAQARRTRDLWYGSHLLSELGRAAVRALVGHGARLIFPALEEGHAELAPCPSPLRKNGNAPLNIANKLLSEVPAGTDPQEVARAAREAVMRFWHDDVAALVQQKCAGLLADGIDTIWDEQINTCVEFAATWAPLGDYAGARRAAEQAVAARKNLRDFAPWRQQRGNVPKSSLDGARETVLRQPSQRNMQLARRYRIADGEQLDAVGLVKRAGGDPDQFVPIVNIALTCWIDLAAREVQERLGALKDACRDVGLARVERQALPCAARFPFDASILLRSRWKSVFEEQGLSGDPEAWGRKNVQPLLDKLGEPYPYIACLVADGDHMGKAIAAMGSADEHRVLSRQLADFAGEARKIIEQDHRGSLVYAGGDDVLAFLPLPEALACAGALRRSFTAAVAGACTMLPEAKQPTLSVGVGVGHVMESMGDLLALGREAEKLAKHGRDGERDRNALSIVLDKRSGGTHSWRARWDECDPVARLQADAELLGSRLSSRKVHEISRTLARLPKPAQADDAGWVRVLALEVRRSLARVHAGEGGIDVDAVGLSLDESAGYRALHAQVSSWIERMLVARAFAAAVSRLRLSVEEVVA